MVKTNRSTLHPVYNIQQPATQGSNDTTHRLSRKTAATTRFSPEGGCQKQTAPRFCQQSDQVGHYIASIHQMRPPKRGRTHRIALLLTYRPRKDERLSRPSWLMQWTVYPHKRSPGVSCRSSAGQRKFAGEISTFHHCTTQPTQVISELSPV